MVNTFFGQTDSVKVTVYYYYHLIGALSVAGHKKKLIILLKFK